MVLSNETRLAVLFLIGFSVFGCVELKQAGRTVGHTTRDVAKEIGHTSRDVAKEIGHASRDVAKDISEGTKRVMTEVTEEEDEEQ